MAELAVFGSFAVSAALGVGAMFVFWLYTQRPWQ